MHDVINEQKIVNALPSVGDAYENSKVLNVCRCTTKKPAVPVYLVTTEDMQKYYVTLQTDICLGKSGPGKGFPAIRKEC